VWVYYIEKRKEKFKNSRNNKENKENSCTHKCACTNTRDVVVIGVMRFAFSALTSCDFMFVALALYQFIN